MVRLAHELFPFPSTGTAHLNLHCENELAFRNLVSLPFNRDCASQLGQRGYVGRTIPSFPSLQPGLRISTNQVDGTIISPSTCFPSLQMGQRISTMHFDFNGNIPSEFPFPSNGTAHLNYAEKFREFGIPLVWFPFPSNGTAHLNARKRLAKHSGRRSSFHSLQTGQRISTLPF